MADLPGVRCEPYKPPFTNSGVDCFGNFYVTIGRSSVKRYGCVFVCLSTRAIHIEKLELMDSDSFINCLRRFTARRGVPDTLYCDHGSNFMGAISELKELSEEQIQDYCQRQDIQWILNPPAASHMSGAWERLIRTIRKVLNPMLLNAGSLKDEVLETFFCEVENVVNGRPLTYVGDSADDLAPLSPNHFLRLRDGSALPPGSFCPNDKYRSRWMYVQHLANQFWSRWTKEYLADLQARQKWHDDQRDLKVGDVVVILDESTPRYLWPLGRVVEVKEGRDKHVRAAVVKTKASRLERPITKLVLVEACI